MVYPTDQTPTSGIDHGRIRTDLRAVEAIIGPFGSSAGVVGSGPDAATHLAGRVVRLDRLRRRGLFPPNPVSRFATLPTVMSSPPTVAVSAAGAATTISGATHRQANQLPINFLGGRYVDVGTRGGFAGGLDIGYLTSSLVPSRAKVEFMTDADVFEIVTYVTATSPNNKYRALVDGQYVTSATPTATGFATQNSLYRVKYTFSGRAIRRFQFELGWSEFIGIAAHPTSTFWKPDRPVGPTVVWMGDSFSEGTGADWGFDSYADWCGQLLGWNVCGQGVGGTGYLANGGGGGKVKFRSRVTNDVTALSPDIVVVAGGYNDSGFTAAQVQTEADLLYAQILSENPNATLIVTSGFMPVGVTTTNIHTQIRDALKTEAGQVTPYFVDMLQFGNADIANPISWITGNGKVGATNGTGNADYYISNDGTHPSPAGHLYKGRRMASAIAAIAAGVAA